MYAFPIPIRFRRRGRSSDRGVLPILLLCVVCMLLTTGCTLPWQHPAQAANLGPRPTAQQVLTALQKNFRSVTSFHISLKTDNLGNTSSVQIALRDADGDVLMPDKIRAQASVLLSGQAVTINLISIGANQYITDPITGQWRVVKGMFDPRILTDPDSGIIPLAGKLQDVTGPTADSVNNTSCWRVNGLLPANDLAFFTDSNTSAGTMLKTSICAGQSDGLPYEITVVGQAAKGDTAQTIRTFVISKYGESISIVAPQV
ncbi:MAG TPA: LppX_LprAFG lipoprotein [Ktedonobacteraceae bacterium]|nr:LppX_LprAFG lipoprotein [Ktedonobacteraceae bacterium]